MTLKSYLWVMRVSTIFALAGWVYVINFVDPEDYGIFGKILFFGISFLLLSGIFFLLLSGLRRKAIEKGEVEIGTNLRQGTLLSILAVTLLFFQSIRILVWWDGLLVAAGIFLVELYFLSQKE